MARDHGWDIAQSDRTVEALRLFHRPWSRIRLLAEPPACSPASSAQHEDLRPTAADRTVAFGAGLFRPANEHRGDSRHAASIQTGSMKYTTYGDVVSSFAEYSPAHLSVCYLQELVR